MANKKCLIIDKMHTSIIMMLEEIGFEVHYLPELSRQQIIQQIPEYTGIIVRSKTFLDAEILAAAMNLKFIGRAGAGLDLIDLDVAAERNIAILNAPEGNRDAVAEHCMGMLLNLLNKINQADRQVREQIWDREGNRGVELMGRTVALIGYGNMGQAFAQRLHCFGCKVLAFDKYRKEYSDTYASEVDMQEVYMQADILSLHIPLSNESRGMVDEAYVRKFHKPIYLMNTARGEIINLSHLVKMMQSGKITGAALDVLENEKIKNLTEEQQVSFDYLVGSPNTILTPHVAGWSEESYIKINQSLIQKIRQLNLL